MVEGTRIAMPFNCGFGVQVTLCIFRELVEVGVFVFGGHVCFPFKCNYDCNMADFDLSVGNDDRGELCRVVM
jgi:hypothetical protein